MSSVAALRDIDSVAPKKPGIIEIRDLCKTFGSGESQIEVLSGLDLHIDAGDRVAIVEIDPASWRRVIDVNLNGSFYMSQVFGRRL